MTSSKIITKTYIFIGQYLEMELNGYAVHCPYWANKLKNGKVIIRGFLNGKGDARSIRAHFIDLLKDQKSGNNSTDKILSNMESFRKYAKRNRTGIDCSGFVYRILDSLVSLGFVKRDIKKLADIFPGGISKTNADKLTGPEFTVKINSVSNARFGDLIRLNGGKHVIFITGVSSGKLEYVHSSSKLTRDQGVHEGIIKLVREKQNLSDQIWMENTKTGNNLGKEYFKIRDSDGIYRPVFLPD
ncbi:hypothetical protein A3D05_02755 [Candidatus Gottesmanbacteria bacterium RIFCSPHIGHO2_02_FULL_40_24]|uniref:Uncharacterized protein n=1 Tax=Candidatus Gottesmanbacteria bacterium RIFCSPHIGHO2_01_FULL_40_15 TaxID=1798376 RepID=A0A1F5Z7Y6_9BACT|nr:MAG: hypothetical protein A2777_06260 [Candidatus Gottesmanbacteria bacterium RIFCSPHIGHO2_01_FULL_40_15]OGG18107.1 MAG: hypothetical protein A3D05_02755 [Candidatus Gottesmanbacteria bacterium RIFCSPHIGHO2_02_FULL_40_24]OGG21027.1 MAG: hypothetical protein A3B48_03745 [Candidatus Gottesmanbacteria bacterium RIFCSPLOWO2_01_FULL_40_10]OGG25050.1 MAG: hypothetical protein A3E42_05140 [Candidatus Gottesmanbacteria bacterium RIFCSPHIGHO2_12_FULL_40_13]OGG33877.1 MAG: hypothetical protein A3I80_0